MQQPLNDLVPIQYTKDHQLHVHIHVTVHIHPNFLLLQ